MESSIKIINAGLKNLNKIIELENKIWLKGTRASRKKFESRLEIFPEGFFIAIKDKELIGVSTSEIISYNPENLPVSWESITDNGYIKKTHNPKGKALYVVSIGAVSRSGAGSALLKAQKELVKKLNLELLILGARISDYNAYCIKNGDIKIEDYINLKRKDGQLLDSELRFYTRNGLRLLKIVPNYMEEDEESRNYGALMIYKKISKKVY